MVCHACGVEAPPEAPACLACGCPLEAPLPFPLGKVLEGRYRVESVAGRGGMGVVYRGVDLTLSRPVAVKVMINADPAILARFMREARSLAKVEHRGLVPVYAVGREEGVFYMIMKFIEGQTLSDRLKAGPLEPEALRRMLIEAADALWTLHRAELIHRDMKPGNLILGPDGRVTIMDLGIVKTVGEQTTAQMLGTPKYMPPEMLTQKELDGRADLYALGVIAYQAAEGQVPFDAPTPMGILYKHAHEAPPPLTRKIPKDLSKIIFKLLSKQPEQRYEDAEALIAALTPKAAGRGLRLRWPWARRQAPTRAPASFIRATPSADFSPATPSADLSPPTRAPQPADEINPFDVGEDNPFAIAETSDFTLVPAVTPGSAPGRGRAARLLIGGLLILGLGIGGALRWRRAPEGPSPTADAGIVVISVASFPPLREDAALSAPPSDAPDAAPAVDAAPLSPPPPPPPLASEVTVQINSTPAGVSVLHNGAALGQTPLKLKRPKGSPEIKLRLIKAGYSPQWLKVSFEESKRLSPTLSAAFELVP
ncbi:protein kinase [Myxococcota bacterium]|nr:protein kinase [Myxococcota bacterium]